MQMRTFVTVLATLLVCKAVAGPQPLHSGDVGVTLPLTGEQSAASAKPNFEVASIKLNEHWKFSPPPYSLDSDENFVSGQSLFIVDAPLTSLIAFAYKLNSQYTMLANLPKWATSQSLHVSARIPGNPTKDGVREMMKTLLSERYHLQLHYEKQEKSVFALSLIRAGQLGPGLHHFVSCKVEGTPPKRDDVITDLGWLPCNTYLALDKPGGAVFVAARDTTMSQLCAFLSSVGDFGRMVVDRSGVTESIDFGIEYTKARLTTEGSEMSRSEPLESALKNQLGVKLTPLKTMVDVPIIDQLDPLIAD